MSFKILLAFLICFIVSFFILIISYLVLKKFRGISLKYVFFVSVGNALIDVVFLFFPRLVSWLFFPFRFLPSEQFAFLYPQTTNTILFLYSLLIGFIVIFIYNYLLARKFPKLTIKKAIFVSIIFGIFANPYLFGWFFF